ncbi:MAG TPA: hydrolase [Arenibaculum sp.]|nr:hydrolase [Arenibaculum sp.]
MLLEAARSVLLVVDVQERLVPAVAESQAVVRRIATLLRAAGPVGVPAFATEHYPSGIGPTVPELRGFLAEGTRLEKIHFSAAREPGLVGRVTAGGRDQVVVCGMETHVCVLQTVLGLRQAGVGCWLVADAVGSRRALDRELAIERMRGHGVEIVTAEMVMFEWLHRGGTALFREVLPLIR